MTTPGYVATDVDQYKQRKEADVIKLRTNIKKINPYMIKSITPKINKKSKDRSSVDKQTLKTLKIIIKE